MTLLQYFFFAIWAALVSATSVAEQFHLSTQTQASACFIRCHSEYTSLNQLPDGRNNFPQAITLNCDHEHWQQTMGKCIAATCASAPDLAYAVEYGQHFCKRAGVPNVEFPLPERFLQSAGGEYYASTLESGAGRLTTTVAGMAACAVAAALMVIA